MPQQTQRREEMEQMAVTRTQSICVKTCNMFQSFETYFQPERPEGFFIFLNFYGVQFEFEEK